MTVLMDLKLKFYFLRLSSKSKSFLWSLVIYKKKNLGHQVTILTSQGCHYRSFPLYVQLHSLETVVKKRHEEWLQRNDAVNK